MFHFFKRYGHPLLSWTVLVIMLTGCGSGNNLKLVAKGAEIVKLHNGFAFTEGPAADGSGNVFFSDIPKSTIYRINTKGSITPFLKDSKRSNGLCFDTRGNLLVCEQATGRIVRITAEGKKEIVADTYNGRRFNSPNDLWIDTKGGIYFSDPFFGITKEMSQDGEHVYYITPAGKVHRVIDDLNKPNGLIGSANGKLLYVADQGKGQIWTYTIDPDGSLGNKTVFAKETADGITRDALGNLYLATDCVCVYDSKGRKIGKISVPEKPSNMCFGGNDMKTLYITARKYVYTIKMKIAGAAI